MLTLSSISQRIEQLETEEYSAINTRLDTWYAMLQWMYWIHSLNGDDYHKHFEALPAQHSVRVARGKLTWFTVHFANALPDVTWKSEKAELCFAAWIEEAIAEGYTESALCCEEAMNDAIQFVAECLQNGTLNFYDVKKKEEQENWTKKLEFRRLANFGELTPEVSAWLEENDAAFWTNFNAKKQTEVKPTEVKPARVEAIPEALPEVKLEVPKPTNEYVSAFWTGLDQGWLVDSLNGTLPVYRGREYHLSLQTWQNIESDSYLRQRWHRTSNEK